MYLVGRFEDAGSCVLRLPKWVAIIYSIKIKWLDIRDGDFARIIACENSFYYGFFK